MTEMNMIDHDNEWKWECSKCGAILIDTPYFELKNECPKCGEGIAKFHSPFEGIEENGQN